MTALQATFFAVLCILNRAFLYYSLWPAFVKWHANKYIIVCTVQRCVFKLSVDLGLVAVNSSDFLTRLVLPYNLWLSSAVTFQ